MNKKQLIVAAALLSLIPLTTFAQDTALVKRVIDGDTIELADGERVRLIGIDNPEMYKTDKLYRDSRRTAQDIKTIQKMGQQAYEFTKKLAEGKRVRLEYDVQKQDQYGRTLAYVYVKTRFNKEKGDFDDDTSREIMLNAEIIKQGYASIMTIPPNVKYADLLQRLYQEARENNRGLHR